MPASPAAIAGNRPGSRVVSSVGTAGEDGMANRDILAIGTSAGGVEAVTFLAKQFRRGFPASVLVTIHLASNARSALTSC